MDEFKNQIIHYLNVLNTVGEGVHISLEMIDHIRKILERLHPIENDTQPEPRLITSSSQINKKPIKRVNNI